MKFKPDFESIVPRMEAYWKGELLDRACIAVAAPNGKPQREVTEPDSPFERRSNIEYLLDSAEARMEATYYAGEAIPVFRPDLGPDVFSAFLGAPMEYTEHTTWAKQIITDWDNPPALDVDRDSFEWQWHHKVYAAAAERARGRYFLAAPDCHSGGDALLAMRGGSRLCMDVYDHPEALRAAMRKLEQAVVEFHEEWWEPIEASGQRGHTLSWLNTWTPGRSNVIQLDLLAAISPPHFQQFFQHELEVQIEVLDQTAYHLDGPDAIPHVPVLHEFLGHTPDRSGDREREWVIPIQWVPGVGAPPMGQWVPFLKELQAGGANLHLWCEAGEVETLLTELSSRGLCLWTWAGSVDEADSLVRLADKLAHL